MPISSTVTRVALADDHAIVLLGLKMVLADADGITVVGEASDGASLEVLLRDQQVDVLVMDLGMPGVEGVAYVRGLRARHPALRILILTGDADAATAAGVADAGANGYLVKTGNVDQLIPAITALREGRGYFGHHGLDAKPATLRPAAGLAALTRREQQILLLIARGATAADVASKLDISPLTARKHRENLMRKLDLHNTAGLIAYAVRHGIAVGQD